jgi:hypothetical protein
MPEPPIELLNEDPEVAVDDGLSGLDLLHFAVEGSPVHPLGLGTVVADAARGPEPVAALEGATDGAIVGRLALGSVGEAVSAL